MTTRMLLLPADPRAPARCVHLDDSGRVLAQATLVTDAPAQPAPFPAATRTVLVVPGAEVRTLWLEIAAHSQAQALAAARVLVAEGLAMPGDLHVAVAAAAVGGMRAVAVVERALLRGWLAHAAALGLAADSALPEQLLLPPPPDAGDGDAVRVFDAGDRWLVRGAGFAFSAEPDLAAQVLADRPFSNVGSDEFDRAWSRARAPEVELLQGDFTPASARSAAGAGGKRRLAWLAAALLASPLLLVAAQALRLELAARGFESRAAATLQAALPAAAAGSATPETLSARLADAQAPQAFAAASGALFAAVAARPGARLESLDYHRGDSLRATLFHPAAGDLEALRAALAAEGWRLLDQGSVEDAGGLVTDLALEPAA